jgi:hypothetical protein
MTPEQVHAAGLAAELEKARVQIRAEQQCLDDKKASEPPFKSKP